MVFRSNDRIWIISVIVRGIIILSVTIVFVGQGNIRHVTIFWNEKVEQTVIFEEIGQ